MQLVDYVLCFMFKQLKVPMKKYQYFMLMLLDALMSVVMTISPKRLTEKDYFVELYVCKKLWNE